MQFFTRLRLALSVFGQFVMGDLFESADHDGIERQFGNRSIARAPRATNRFTLCPSCFREAFPK